MEQVQQGSEIMKQAIENKVESNKEFIGAYLEDAKSISDSKKEVAVANSAAVISNSILNMTEQTNISQNNNQFLNSGFLPNSNIEIVKQTSNLQGVEKESVVQSVFVENKEFENFADFAKDTINEDVVEKIQVDPLTKTPLIPDSVFLNLPKLLKQGCGYFKSERERDVFLTSALPILSGCFQSVHGVYRQQTVYPNLFTFVVAPAANGKSALVFSKQLGMKIHKALVDESKAKKALYNLQLKQYNTAKKGKKSRNEVSPSTVPVEPPFKVLFIPGDVSSSRVIDHIVSNGGNGIFCESEADSMGNSFKQEWGGYSTLLRKAFHHETMAYSRKGGSEFQEIDSPRLSVVLSGTPSQINNIIQSAEDGLFSRFMYYTFKEQPKWQDVSPMDKENLTLRFDELSQTVASYAQKVNGQPIKFDLTRSQWLMVNQVFSKWLIEVSTLVSEDADSSIKRLGLILFRIAMTLSILKYAEANETGTEITCSDADFETALALAQVYKEHSLQMFRQLPRTALKIDKNKQKFFDALPCDKMFKRQEALDAGKQMEISERSVGTYLTLFSHNGLLDKPKYGFYQKVA